MPELEFKKQLLNKEQVVSYFMNYNKYQIKRITYFDADSFGSGINLYFLSKKYNITAAEAFSVCWMAQFLWEEDSEDSFSFDQDRLSVLYTNVFLDNIEKYLYLKLDEQKTKRILSKSTKPIREKIKLLDRSSSECHFLETTGIYVNKQLVNKNPAILNENESIEKSILLYSESSNNLSRGCELFFETSHKYCFYTY